MHFYNNVETPTVMLGGFVESNPHPFKNIYYPFIDPYLGETLLNANKLFPKKRPASPRPKTLTVKL